MKKSIYLIAALIVTLTACESPKEKQLKEIDALEIQDSTFSIDNMARLKEAYVTFADKYPDDEHTPEFLFKAAQRCNVLASQNNESKQHEEAVKLFERIKVNYPKHEMAPEAMFLTGYIYENHLGDTTRAKIVYNDFMREYPDNELAEEAKIALQNMSVPLNQIIQKQQKEAADTTVSAPMP